MIVDSKINQFCCKGEICILYFRPEPRLCTLNHTLSSQLRRVVVNGDRRFSGAQPDGVPTFPFPELFVRSKSVVSVLILAEVVDDGAEDVPGPAVDGLRDSG